MSPVPETLAQGEAGGDGQSDSSLPQCEGQQGGEDEDPDQLEVELGPGPGAGDDGAGPDGVGGQHGPVEEGEELRAEPSVVHPRAGIHCLTLSLNSTL